MQTKNYNNALLGLYTIVYIGLVYNSNYSKEVAGNGVIQN